ncbi:MAG: hypothetical protein WCF18_17185 [Chthoniobacteraceae bacterium]
MKYPTLRTALLLLLTTTTVSFATVDDILANLGAFKPKITVSDTYSEKVLTEVDDGNTFRNVESNPERIAVSLTANLNGADVGAIDADTAVGITAGYFDHSGVLGEAADYKLGNKRATFPLLKDMERANGDTYQVQVGAVIYAWTDKQLTVTVTCTDIEAAGVNDIATSDYVGIADPGTTVSFAGDTTDVTVNFGDATGTRRVFLKGESATVTRSFGSEAAGNNEDLDLIEVNVKGAADVVGPVVKAAFPATIAANRTINIAGSATDDQTTATFDSITVNGVESTPASSSSTDAENGSLNWNVTGLPMVKGKNVVVLSFSDEDGNVTQVTKTYVPDGKGPIVKANFPLKPTGTNTIDITGFADDATLITLDGVTVNGAAVTPASVGPGDNGADAWLWSVRGVQLAKGRNVVVLSFSDVDGNVTKVSKTYTLSK